MFVPNEGHLFGLRNWQQAREATVEWFVRQIQPDHESDHTLVIR
jgi:hypothetical protein